MGLSKESEILILNDISEPGTYDFVVEFGYIPWDSLSDSGSETDSSEGVTFSITVFPKITSDSAKTLGTITPIMATVTIAMMKTDFNEVFS